MQLSKKYCDKQGLCQTFTKLISDDVLIKEEMNPILFKNCLLEISDKYNDVPYHNRQHAESVMLACETIFQSCVQRLSYLNDNFNHIALLFAASIHDIDHPGDAAPALERHHVDVAFLLLQRPECNFLSTMSVEKKLRFEELIRYLVMSTDMNQHEHKIKLFKMINFENNFNNNDSTRSLLSMILKCADLWHAVLPWPNHKLWTERYLLEQGENVTEATVQNQLWFLQVRCKPCFRALSQLFPSCRSFSRNLDVNLSIWRAAVTAC